MESYIEKHNKKLRLTIDDEGEHCVEHHHFNNHFCYLIGRDEIVRVNENAYKFFEKGVAVTNFMNINELKNFKNIELHSGTENGISDTPFEQYDIFYSKDAANNCGTDKEKSRYCTNGKERISMSIKCRVFCANHIGCVPQFQVYVRALRKAVVWYRVKRDIEVSIKIAIDYRDPISPNNWYRHIETAHIPKGNRKSINEQLSVPAFYERSFSIHFGGYDCWATSKTVVDENGNMRVSRLQCNTSLF